MHVYKKDGTLTDQNGGVYPAAAGVDEGEGAPNAFQ